MANASKQPSAVTGFTRMLLVDGLTLAMLFAPLGLLVLAESSGFAPKVNGWITIGLLVAGVTSGWRWYSYANRRWPKDEDASLPEAFGKQLWMCDYECIEGSGSYREVIEQLELLTDRALDLQGIEDHVDEDARTAWVEFTHRGMRVRWSLKVDKDWMDRGVIELYDSLLAESGSARRLYINDRDYGQSSLLAALTQDEYDQFRKLTRVRLKRVSRSAGPAT